MKLYLQKIIRLVFYLVVGRIYLVKSNSQIQAYRYDYRRNRFEKDRLDRFRLGVGIAVILREQYSEVGTFYPIQSLPDLRKAVAFGKEALSPDPHSHCLWISRKEKEGRQVCLWFIDQELQAFFNARHFSFIFPETLMMSLTQDRPGVVASKREGKFLFSSYDEKRHRMLSLLFKGKDKASALQEFLRSSGQAASKEKLQWLGTEADETQVFSQLLPRIFKLPLTIWMHCLFVNTRALKKIKLKYLLLQGGFILICLSAPWFVSLYGMGHHKEILQQRIDNMAPKTRKYQSLYSEYEVELGVYEKLKGHFANYTPKGVILSEIKKMVSQGKVELRDLQVIDTQVVMRGTAESASHFIGMLNQSPVFSSITLPQPLVKERGSKKERFVIHASIKPVDEGKNREQ